ncbi:MAG TPA: sialidase family protein [Chloroflexota bacterium]|nr:sialidase family protein [Chloroflexota bacterium]
MAPINLSQSGTANTPQAVVDANGVVHIVWQDSLDGIVYVQGNNRTWSIPQLAELPFGTRRYSTDLSAQDRTPLFPAHLFADENNLIHAFWLDAENGLFRSRVEADAFTVFDAWDLRQQIADDVLAFDVSMDENGRHHLVYLTSNPTLPGLFYVSSDDGGFTWSEPFLIYSSNYFRLLTKADANVHLAIDDNANVHIAWDDQALEQILVASSFDNGQNWSQPLVLDSRQEMDAMDAVGPSGIQMSTDGNAVHLTWQAGHDGAACDLYHQWSPDNGRTWESPQLPLAEFDQCPEESQFLTGGSWPVLVAKLAAQNHLLLWKDGHWGIPQPQAELTSFIDETVFRSISLTCGRQIFVHNDQLGVVSCGRGVGQDVWFTSRPLQSLDVAPLTDPLWSTPAAVAVLDGLILSSDIVVDQENRLHMMWSQSQGNEIVPAFPQPGQELHYEQWDSGRWIGPTTILSTSGYADQPAITTGQDGLILAVWRGNTGDHLYFSQANGARAASFLEWMSPQLLANHQSAIGDPDILIDPAGNIYVAYVVLVNEERGVYLLTSSDGGKTWSSAHLFTDIGLEGDLPQQPRLAWTQDNRLHMLWQQKTLPESLGKSTLYYAQTQDGGVTWSEPALVERSNQATSPILWNDMVGIGERIVHRTWQDWDGSRLNLWHQQSLDSGRTWSPAVRVASVTDPYAVAALVVDQAEVVYLLQLEKETSIGRDASFLRHWLWQGVRWQEEEAMELSPQPVEERATLLSAVMADGRMVALYNGTTNIEGTVQAQLLLTERMVATPAVTATPLPTLTPTPTEAPEDMALAATPTTQATPTVDFTLGVNENSGGSSLLPGFLSSGNALVAAAILTIIPVGLLVMLTFILRLRALRSKQ